MEKITALQSFDFTSSLEKMSQVHLKEKAKWATEEASNLPKVPQNFQLQVFNYSRFNLWNMM